MIIMSNNKPKTPQAPKPSPQPSVQPPPKREDFDRSLPRSPKPPTPKK